MKLKFWERFKGFWTKGTSTAPKRERFHVGEHSWIERCRHYEHIFATHALAKAQILTVAGQLMSDGIFVEATDDYQRAEEAKDRIDKLNQEIGVEVLVYDTAVYLAKFGSCFWEKTFSPNFDCRLIPMQETVDPAEKDGQGNITRWRKTLHGQEAASWNENEIVHFGWNITTESWPYGTSLLQGLNNEFEILEQLETDIKEHMHKTAFPNEIIQVGDGTFMPTPSEVSSIRSDVRNWKPGERHVTSYPSSRIEAGTGGNRISDLGEVLNFVKEQLIDGLMVPPISKQWSSTMASAQEMMPWARANLIQPMQRLISRKIEREVYRPYLESLGYSIRICPQLKWEAPDAHKDEEAEYWALQVQSGIVPPEYAAEQQGFDLQKIEDAKLKREREQAIKQELDRAQREKEQEQFPINVKQAAHQTTMPETTETSKPHLDVLLQRLLLGINSKLETVETQRQQIKRLEMLLQSKSVEHQQLREQEAKVLTYLMEEFGL